MSIADDITAALPELRRQNASLLVDTATISRPAPGPGTFNPATGLVTVTTTDIHTGPCRVRQPDTTELERLFGERQTTTTRYVACFPHDLTGVQIGDIVTVTDTADPDLADLRLRIVATPASTWSLHKCFPCEATT